LTSERTERLRKELATFVDGEAEALQRLSLFLEQALAPREDDVDEQAIWARVVERCWPDP
jgi:hypothetical protein